MNNTEFASLVGELKTPLPTQKTLVDELRAKIAFAESSGIILSQYVRTLSQVLDEETAKALTELKEDDVYIKSNADEKKLLLYSKTSELRARLEYMEKLEELVKRRCSLGQSLLKSVDLETRASFNS